MLLDDIIALKHYNFVDKEVTSWEEAIKLSCKSIEKDGTVDESYAQLLIDSVKKYGPYIVLLPDIAMPHTTQNAKGVHKTCIAFTCFKTSVDFDKNDPSKSARIFFTLSAVNSDEHLTNMEQLFGLFTDDSILDSIRAVKNLDDLKAIAARLHN